MKKHILFISIMIGAFIFAGCSANNSSTENIQETTNASHSPTEEPTSSLPENSGTSNAEATQSTSSGASCEGELKINGVTQTAPPETTTSDQNENYLGDFQATNLQGEKVTPSIFSDYDLTLVNVFATWCPPCLQEMPDLESVSQDMKDQSVQVVGIALDVNYMNQSDPEMLSVLHQVAQETGVTYPIILPDEVLYDLFADINSVPTTFFVDKNGNIVGDTYLGARNKKQWLSIIETEKQNLGNQS